MYNTGNPVGSANPKDLFDNSEAFDQGMNGSATTFTNRLGQTQFSWAAFNQMTINALAQVGATISNAQAAINAAKDGAIESIDASVDDVDQAKANALIAMAVAVSELSDDLGNKGFDLKSQMLAYTPKYDGTLAWVQKDPTPENNGFYQYRAGALPSPWVKPNPQPALSTDIDALYRAITPRKRPLGPVTGDTPLIFSFGGVLVSLPVQKKRPLGPDGRQGAYMTMGDSLMLSLEPRKRPLTEAYSEDVLLLSGDSVMLRSGGSVTPVTPTTTYDAKQIQEQSQPPAGTRQAAIVAGQVWAYAPTGTTQLTAAGTWLAAQAVAFDIVRALKSAAAPGSNQPHSITKDGRIFRDGNVLWHKLCTGQSLGLGTCGIVLDVSGEYTIQGRRGNLFTPYVPADFAGRMLTLPGGPRPTSWVGATAFDPVREYVSGSLGETAASSYMLSMLSWLDRNTGIAPKLVYSISALGGTAYAGLKKGTQIYADLIAQVTAAKNIAAADGLDYVVPSISIVHGESQHGVTQAGYVAILAEWISDYRTDIVAITNQPLAPLAYVSQTNTGDASISPNVPLAQLQAHNENPNIILVCPKYQFEHFDQSHLTAPGYIKLGEIEARAERLTMVSGKWQPLKIVSAVRSGVTITLKLNNLPRGNAATPGPIGRLVADAVSIVDPGNYGFLLSAGSISSVAIGADGASVVITTATAVPAGTILTYALQPSFISPHLGSGRRGCIRDTDLRDASRLDGKPNYNWLCATSLELQ